MKWQDASLLCVNPMRTLGALVLGIFFVTAGEIPAQAQMWESLLAAGEIAVSSDLLEETGGWPVYVGNGFRIRHPLGWEVSESGDGCLLLRFSAPHRGRPVRTSLNVSLKAAGPWDTPASRLARLRDERSSTQLLFGERHFLKREEIKRRDRRIVLSTANHDSSMLGELRATISLGRSRVFLEDEIAQAIEADLAHLSAMAASFEFAGRIRITSPSYGVARCAGETLPIAWSTDGFDTSCVVEIILHDARYTYEHPKGRATIATVANTGRYSWTIPESLDVLGRLGSDWPRYAIVVRISGGGGTICAHTGTIFIHGEKEPWRLPPSSWLTYRNEEYEFQIRYPDYFTCNEIPDSSRADGVIVAFRMSPEAGQRCFPNATLRGMRMFIARCDDEGCIRDCLKPKPHGDQHRGLVKPGPVTVGGKRFFRDRLRDGATGSIYVTDTYSMVYKGACYEMGLQVSGTNPGHLYESDQDLIEIEPGEVIAELERVLATLEFVD